MFRSIPIRAAGLALLTVAIAAPTAAAAQPADMQLETGPNNTTLKLGDIASANQIAVVFQNANKSYLRWSADGGSTFTPRHALRSGLRAKNPRVDACGNLIWAASEWTSDAGQKIGVDVFDANTGTTKKFAVAPGSAPDVACIGTIVAVTWFNDGHEFVAVYDGPCIHSCVYYQKDLGAADYDSPARVAATDDGFAVSWMASDVNVEHFAVTNNGAIHVVAGPVVPVVPSSGSYSPVVAGDGSRVVVAYSRFGQTHMRISEDYGATFGSRVIVSNYCRNCDDGGSRPMSVDALNGDILVEVLQAGGTPPDFSAQGFLTHNDGGTWLKTPSNRGQKFGVLRGSTLAEAWDDSLARGFPYPSRPQVIMFHIRNI